MFEINEMRRIVALQSKSYDLLRWVSDGLGRNTLSFAAIHDAMSLSEAAKEWLYRNTHGLPQDVRVDASDLPAFASLFASYLVTSFTLLESPDIRYRSRSGCYCEFCRRLLSASSLKVRQPEKKAQERAREMKQLYLSGLATELGGPLPFDSLATLLSLPTLSAPISYATYGHELLRRSRFASQGEGALVLWREIAWEKGKPRKGFILSGDSMITAETVIAEAIIAAQ